MKIRKNKNGPIYYNYDDDEFVQSKHFLLFGVVKKNSPVFQIFQAHKLSF